MKPCSSPFQFYSPEDDVGDWYLLETGDIIRNGDIYENAPKTRWLAIGSTGVNLDGIPLYDARYSSVYRYVPAKVILCAELREELP
jgi:hypothetical protein